ncbi:MAG: M23 family metallopeptidase [Chloroflexota bacterium]
MSVFQGLIDLLSSLFGGQKASATASPSDDFDMDDDFDFDHDNPGFGGGDTPAAAPPPPITALPAAPQRASRTETLTAQVTNRARIEHCLVLPSQDFREWFDATANYRQAFERVAIVRTPAGNNLNRYKVVSAVKAPRTWFNDDPLFHIRRAYPVVVDVDIVDATTPSQLKAVLDERVRNNTRFGSDDNVFTRFTLDWMTDSFSLQILRVFNQDLGNRRNEGLDIATQPGTTVRAATDGTVINVIDQPNSAVDYGRYVQIRTVADDGKRYTLTYTNLQNLTVTQGAFVDVGQPIGEAEGSAIKVIVQQQGVVTGPAFPLPGAIDPLPLIYVNDMTIHNIADGNLNIRRGQSTQFDRVGTMDTDEVAYSLELPGIAIRKLNTTSTDNRWLSVDTASGVTGFGAAWLLQARSPYSVLPDVDINGMNLDVLNRLGRPDPSRLGQMTWVRLPYKVSMETGNQDLNKAYEVYAPYIDALNRAGKKVMIVYTHQTYGEGAGFVWPQMNPSRWRELSSLFSDFVRQIAQRHRGQIAAHQIWNEQDAGPNARASVPIPPADYGGILSSAIQAIRSVDATTPILTGGHNSGPFNGSNYARTTLNNMPASVRPDGIAFHPYGRGPDVTSKYAIFGSIDDSITAFYNVLPGKRVWITEWGVLNARGEPAGDINAYASSFLRHIQQTQPDKVATAIWYAWSDTMDNGYGLVGTNDQPKQPLFSSYTSIK